MLQYWGSTRHFFLLTLYNFENIGGGGHVPPPLAPYSAVPDILKITVQHACIIIIVICVTGVLPGLPFATERAIWNIWNMGIDAEGALR